MLPTNNIQIIRIFAQIFFEFKTQMPQFLAVTIYDGRRFYARKLNGRKRNKKMASLNFANSLSCIEMEYGDRINLIETSMLRCANQL